MPIVRIPVINGSGVQLTDEYILLERRIYGSNGPIEYRLSFIQEERHLHTILSKKDTSISAVFSGLRVFRDTRWKLANYLITDENTDNWTWAA